MAGHTPRRIASVLTRGFLGGGQNGFSALHLAARHGHLAVVKYLVEKAGADVLLKSERGQTPPGVAAAAIADYMQLVSRDWFAVSACMWGAVLMVEWMWQAASLAPVKKLARQIAWNVLLVRHHSVEIRYALLVLLDITHQVYLHLITVMSVLLVMVVML